MRVVNKGIKLRLGDGQNNVAYVADIVEGMIAAIESDNTIGQTYLLEKAPPTHGRRSWMSWPSL